MRHSADQALEVEWTHWHSSPVDTPESPHNDSDAEIDIDQINAALNSATERYNMEFHADAKAA